MGQARVQIQILPDHVFPESIQLIMSRSLAKLLGINTQPFLVTYGLATAPASLAVSRMSGNLIRMSSRLASRLRMTPAPMINARFDPKTLRLRFGPLLGILINTQPLGQELPFGLMTKFLDECSIAGRSQGLQVAVFAPEHIDVDRKSIRGWIRDKERWVTNQFPLPDVIYNRLTSRRLEQQQSVQDILTRLKRIYRIPIFNEQFLNKYEVYQILVQDERIRSMLPETCPFHPQKAKEMFTRYPVLYLKPNNGSLGGGIIRITREPGKWIYQSATQNGTMTRETRTLAEMIGILRRRIGKQDYLIQQGLNLAKFENRQVDFRVLVQKNRLGEWKITSTIGRIANDHHIVSNLARGGTIRKAAEVLAGLTASQKPEVRDIKKAAQDIAVTFDRLADGHFAELGIDLAVDIRGKIWLIEINSKPSKTDDTVLDPTLTTRPSVRRLLEYVLHLSGMDQRNHSPPPSRMSKNLNIPRRRRPS
jgi:glutathione synthase/RimK-type ligase-like ATP-grasp enzyme